MKSALFDEPGPKALYRHRLAAALSGLVLLAIFVWIVRSLAAAGQLDPGRWAPLANTQLLALLFKGLLATFEVSAVAMVFSVIGGAGLAAGLLSRSRTVRWLLRGWIELFRGLPLLLLIFFIYLGGPALGVDISTFWALVIGLVLFNTVVLAEIFRAGILSLPRGQAEAAAAIGLSPGETFRIVLLPQAARRMLPALISQLVVLLKETSLGFVIGYAEFLRDARTAVEYLGGDYSLSVYTLVAVVYIGVNCVLSWLARRLEAVL